MVIWSLDAFVVRTAGDPAAPAPSARAPQIEPRLAVVLRRTPLSRNPVRGILT
jgi:hypothetical protein